jgi:endoglucanase
MKIPAITAVLLFPCLANAYIPFLGGVNTAGYDFSVVSNAYILMHSCLTSFLQSTDGSFSGTGIDPPVSQYTHFSGQGVNLYRIREYYRCSGVYNRLTFALAAFGTKKIGCSSGNTR